jgi:orotate phosphoribosyltransferase
MNFINNTAQEVARILLEIEAIRLRPEQPFKWSSGWNSPIYCDNRLSLSYPQARTYIKHALTDAIRAHFGDVDIIAGVATAGIPQGALVADVMNLPYCYVRPEPKKHGMGNQIEGQIKAGQSVVVIEDLISTGGSSLKVVDVLREAGVNVLGMAAIFTYGFSVADNNFANKKLKLVCLSNYEILIQEALKLNYITQNQIDTLNNWRINPAEWGI